MPAPPPHPDLALRVLALDDGARATVFSTPHGDVRTPAFMPVATRASLKGLTNTQIDAIGPEMVLANTYHLHLRPGEALVRDRGGLHGFTGIRRPWITDSGGYQVFSLGDLTRVRADGVELRSHLDGTPLFLGPREAIAIQEALGADIIMAFDHCLGLPAKRAALEEAIARTTRWTRLCVASRTRDDQALFGIVQGGTDEELRARSAHDLVELDLPGYAIGGLAVGESQAATRATLAITAPLLPADKPRYLMGLGTPPEMVDAIAEGVDLFDCVLPTRLGRRGHLYTRDGIVRITHRHFAESDEALDPACRCETCATTTRAYLRHLFTVGEHSATTYGAVHNVTFYVDLMRDARQAILEKRYGAFRRAFHARWEAGESAWREARARDPHGAEGSRRARERQRARRAAYDARRSSTPEEGGADAT